LIKSFFLIGETALRLSKTLGRSSESRLIMQKNYNLYQAKKRVNLKDFEKLEMPRKKQRA